MLFLSKAPLFWFYGQLLLEKIHQLKKTSMIWSMISEQGVEPRFYSILKQP